MLIVELIVLGVFIVASGYAGWRWGDRVRAEAEKDVKVAEDTYKAVAPASWYPPDPKA